MAYNFKSIADVEVIAEPTESANVLIEENGVIKRAHKDEVGGGIKVASTAKVGQTIVVKAIDENGNPTEWQCVDRDGLPKGTVILPETTWTFNEIGIDGIQTVDETVNFTLGEEYIVIWDGIAYNCTCFSYSGNAIGNFSTVGGPSNDEPFGMWSSGNFFAYEIGTHTFSIYKNDATGQADWNENDETSITYIQNRPFYTENGLVAVQEETTITLNEEGTGYYDGSWYPDADVIYTVIWDGAEYISEPVYSDSEDCYRFNVTIDGERVNFYEGNTIYGTPAMAGEHTFKVCQEQETVHTIDNKFIPLPAKNGTGSNSIILNHKDNVASGESSYAEGYSTIASGDFSHAEGFDTTASGYNSHAEGNYTTASGDCSHAEGIQTFASGNCSHAEGCGTYASGIRQHVQGRFNINDTESKYAHIVGNGTDYNKPSNAHTLDWEGNAWYQGTVEGTAMIIKSSTSGSTKRFKITVDDSGVISATEVTS